MWLVELANKIHLAEYHMLYFFIFLLCSGLYRMYDGRRRLLFEQQPDDRVNLIPDDEVVQLWHNLTKLNIQFGHFFQKYGLFLVVCAVVNILLFFKTHLTIQEIIKYFGLFAITIIAILLFISISGVFIRQEYSNTKRQCLMGLNSFFNILREKKVIFETYKLFHFEQKTKWEKHYTINYCDVYKYIFDDARIGKEKYIVIGSVIKYLSWSLLIISILAFHFILFWSIKK